MTNEEIALRSIEIIKTCGWTKYIRTDPGGRHCALGAIDKALKAQLTLGYTSESIAEGRAFHEKMKEVIQENYLDKLPKLPGYRWWLDDYAPSVIANFNNFVTTTEDDVIAVFEKVAVS